MSDILDTGYDSEYKLRKHCEAIRNNKVSVAYMMLFLSEQPPNASAARECLDEIEMEDQISIWSCSTKAGGIWTTEERRMLKTGEVVPVLTGRR